MTGNTSIKLEVTPVFATDEHEFICDLQLDGSHLGTLHWRRSDDSEPASLFGISGKPTIVFVGEQAQRVEIARCDFRAGGTYAVRLSFEAPPARIPNDTRQRTHARSRIVLNTFSLE